MQICEEVNARPPPPFHGSYYIVLRMITGLDLSLSHVL
jgi:hypothetical protein